MILLWRLSGTAYLGTLDYGARHYDPRIARWTVPDPMAEKYYGVNAYSYCAGDPVMMVDPDGKDTWEVNGSGKIVKRERDKKKIHSSLLMKKELGQNQSLLIMDQSNPLFPRQNTK